MHAEEAQVVARPQPRHQQLLFGHRRRGFFQHGLDLVERAFAAHEPAADRAIGRQEALVRRLHGGDRRVLGLRHADELAGAADRAVRHMQMVAHQVKKGLSADEFASAQHGVAVTARIALHNEAHPVAQRPAGAGIGGLVARADDHANSSTPASGGFLEDDLQGGLRFALLVNQHLERQRALPGIGRGDEGFADFHGMGLGPDICQQDEVSEGSQRSALRICHRLCRRGKLALLAKVANLETASRKYEALHDGRQVHLARCRRAPWLAPDGMEGGPAMCRFTAANGYLDFHNPLIG